MLIAGFPAGPWGTNCYVVATGPGSECVVIDPGKDAAAGVDQVVREHRLKPVSVLVTHGHVDHMWCVAPVAGTYDATAWIHPSDRHLLSDPMAGMSRETTQMLLGGSYTWAEPDDVRELADLDELELAGLRFVVDHTPGHTEGSVTFRTPYAEQDVSELMFSGDLLFAGSIGRTDLPGGDHATMLRSLTDKVLPLADDIVVLPGHGEQTSIGRERATNPYLLDLRARATPTPPSTRSREDSDEQDQPAQRVPRAAACAARRRARGRRVAVAHLRAARLRQHRDPRRRADRPTRQGRRDRQGDLRPPAPRRRTGRQGRARPPLRPHRAVRALRPGARRSAGVPVPALPDPARLARRAPAGGALPPVHPGRRRHRRARRAALPPRRRGDVGDGRRAGSPADPAGLLPVQQPQAHPGLLPRAGHRRRHRGDPRHRQARQAARRRGRPPARRARRRDPGAGAALPRPRHHPRRRHLLRRAGARPRRERRAPRPGARGAGRGRRGLCRRRRRPGDRRGQPAHRARPRLLHRHRRGDLHERLRAAQVRRRRRSLRRARQRRPDDLPGRRRVVRRLPHPRPAHRRRRPRGQPAGAQRRARRGEHRGRSARQHRGRPRPAGTGKSPARSHPQPPSSASRSGTPSAVASRSSGSSRATAPTRSRTSAPGSRSTQIRRPGPRPATTCTRRSSRRSKTSDPHP